MGSVKTANFEGKEYRAGRSLDGQPGEIGRLVFVSLGSGYVFRDDDNMDYNSVHFEAIPVPLTTITETTTREIKAPDGYEFESGEKRVPKKGELYLNEMFGGVQVCEYQPEPRYILRKIKKEPRTFYAVEYEGGYVACFSREPITIPAPHKVIKLIEVIE